MVVTRATNAEKHPGLLDSSEDPSPATKPRKTKAQADKDKAKQKSTQALQKTALDELERGIEEEQNSLEVLATRPAAIQSATVAQGVSLSGRETVIEIFTPLHDENR